MLLLLSTSDRINTSISSSVPRSDDQHVDTIIIYCQ